MEVSPAQTVQPLSIRNSKYFYNTPENVAIKSTPRKYKINPKALKGENQPESKIKKSSSLHNIKSIDDPSTFDQSFTSIQGIPSRTNITNFSDKQVNVNSDLLARIDKEKKSYESRISDLIQQNENRKKEKEMLMLENKNLNERIKRYQREKKTMSVDMETLKNKLKESDIEYESLIDDKSDDKRDLINASGDCGIDGLSIAVATVGDSISICDDISDDSQLLDMSLSNKLTGNEYLDNLSVETLQDRILKMEEDNYCTREELQATMQELNDLQKAIDKANEENRDLCSERNILLETINEQTKRIESSNNSMEILKRLLIKDFPKKSSNIDTDSEYRRLYELSIEENETLTLQNDVFKDTLMSYHLELKELTINIDKYNEEIKELEKEKSNIEENLRSEIQMREQVEALLRQNHQVINSNFTWIDCSSAVLSLLQQNQALKQQDSDLKMEITRYMDKIKLLETKMNETHTNKENFGDNLEETIDSQRKEIELLSDIIDDIREKYAKDIVEWGKYEKDLLTCIVAANGLKENKEKELNELTNRFRECDNERLKLQEKLKNVSNDNMKCRNCGLTNTSLAVAAAATSNRTSIALNKKSGDQGVALNVKKMIKHIEQQARSSTSLTTDPRSTQEPQTPTMITRQNTTSSISNSLPRSNTTLLKNNLQNNHNVTKNSTTNQKAPFSQLNSVSTANISNVSLSTSLSSNPIINDKSIIQTDKRSSDQELASKKAGNSNISSSRDCLTRTATIDGRRTKDSILPPYHHRVHYPILESVTITKESSPHTIDIVANNLKETTSIIPTPISSSSSSVTTPATPPITTNTTTASKATTEIDEEALPSPQPLDPLAQLVKKTKKGSKRNALLYWCQQKLTEYYPRVEVTNFSSSWNDGLALCALLHSCQSDLINYHMLEEATNQSSVDRKQKRINFQAAFEAAKKAGIEATLDLETMVTSERPEWSMVMKYVVEIYKKFES